MIDIHAHEHDEKAYPFDELVDNTSEFVKLYLIYLIKIYNIISFIILNPDSHNYFTVFVY